MANAIAPMLTVTFKISYDSGVVSEDRKTANIIPVFKKENRSDVRSTWPYVSGREIDSPTKVEV